jgi:hypothetical protein
MSEFPMLDHCKAKAESEGIPHFTIIACDNLATGTLREWISEAKANGINPEKIAEAERSRGAMNLWRSRNPDKCKMPD